MNKNLEEHVNIKKEILFLGIKIIVFVIAIIVILHFIRKPERKSIEKENIPTYYAENMEELHMEEEFKIENYYITEKLNAGTRFEIDNEHVLWGMGIISLVN